MDSPSGTAEETKPYHTTGWDSSGSDNGVVRNTCRGETERRIKKARRFGRKLFLRLIRRPHVHAVCSCGNTLEIARHRKHPGQIPTTSEGEGGDNKPNK